MLCAIVYGRELLSKFLASGTCDSDNADFYNSHLCPGFSLGSIYKQGELFSPQQLRV